MNSTQKIEAPKIILIVGPTGSGKTSFAIHLARQLNGEIVGADSMQIYRYMDIGTAKPTSAERTAAPHHMIDIVEPDQDFDAAVYATMATGMIQKIIARGRSVFVVGGTGLYIKALIYGLFAEGPSDPVVRQRLKRLAETDGSASLHRRLAAVDSQAAGQIHPNDTYRIVRALEVFETTGETLTAVQQRHRFRQRRFNALTFGVSWPRPVLYDRINQRVEIMMDQGFETEVRGLLSRGYKADLKSMQSLGYRHLVACLNGESSLQEAVDAMKRDHRRYAKRQLTWFNADPSVHWMTPDQPHTAIDLIRRFLA